MDWFTSDQHFSHENIIKYVKRPFHSVHEMDETIISNHNSVVKSGDNVYHLGDFAFRNHQQFLQRLNGNHHLIKGNHEGKDWRNAGFAWVKDVATVRCYNGQDIFLSHYAHRVWNRAHYGVIHAFGHSHGSLSDMNKSCDVGVDAWNFFPVSIDQLIERFKDVPPTPHC